MLGNQRLALLTGTASLALLAGCGGGDSSPAVSSTPPVTSQPVSTASTAEGKYTGTFSNNRDAGSIVLDDGSYYFLYTSSSHPEQVGGFIQGTGVSNNGSFTSTNAIDFNFENGTVRQATISASYVSKKTFNGSMAYVGSTSTAVFTGSYEAEYDQTPTLTKPVGTYTSAEGAQIIIKSNGTLTGSKGSCTLTGTIAPRTKGNVYNTQILYGSGCATVTNLTLNGIAVVDSVDGELTVLLLTPTRNVATVFIGAKS